MDIPYRLSIEFTNHCNFRCAICPQSVYGHGPTLGGNRYDRPKGYLSEEVFKAFLKDAQKYARYVTVSFFGEPMLHERFCEYITRLATGRYKLILFSNASLMGKEQMAAMKKCDMVKLSIHEETDTGKIEQWLAVPGHPKTYLVYVTTAENKDIQSAVPRHCRSKLSKRDGIIIKSIISYGGIMKDEYMRPNPCRVLQKPRLVVAWDGSCTPCNLDVNVAMNVGHILQNRGLAGVMKTLQYKRNLRAIKEKKGICANCFDANNHRETVIYHGTKT